MPDTPVVAAAIAAAHRLGFTPLLKGSGGGSDANIYAETGISCAVLSTGMENVHTAEERIAITDMLDAARLLAEIVAIG
jgi:tripeptide aminopeptidase